MSGLTEQAVSSLARSREGHAAYAMSGIDDRWIVIQKNTFTNWVNEQLRSTGQRVEDLQVFVYFIINFFKSVLEGSWNLWPLVAV